MYGHLAKKWDAVKPDDLKRMLLNLMTGSISRDLRAIETTAKLDEFAPSLRIIPQCCHV